MAFTDTRTISAPGKVSRKSSLTEVGIQHRRGQPHTHICLEASPVGWNMTSPLPVLLPRSILLPPSHYTESRCVSNRVFFLIFLLKKKS